MDEQHTEPTGAKILYEEDLRALGIKQHRNTIAAWEAEGKFPKRLTLSSRKASWSAAEIYDWLNAALARRDWRQAGRAMGEQYRGDAPDAPDLGVTPEGGGRKAKKSGGRNA